MRSRPKSRPQLHSSHLRMLVTSPATCSMSMEVLRLPVCCSMRRTNVDGHRSWRQMSPNGPSRYSVATQQFSGFRGEADVDGRTDRAESDAIDPERSLTPLEP